ncbi:putative retrotransposon protein [Klebsormidium nitens]|uniref:Putative retrotransposon protein n=1 Tax=Klebsormidium nitens TaxID=105231 RepID=A0A1Y1IPD0_KLENI|nr:putative retrotransposon protein [Klebsormidium nitens]|eukprot:GAQ92745.1 putative retrotransposon protein [Klebsormidium nitens]
MRLAVRTVPYLGHFIVPGGTAPQDVKVEAIVRMVPPRDISELRAFLGTCGYYRRYVPNYARIAAPLNCLLQNGVVWNWVADEQKAFELLKLKLTEAPVLRHPDFTRPFELYTDWSATGQGAVLAQRDEEGKECVVAYASQSTGNNRTERNYSSYHGECLAAVRGVCYFRVYLYARQFTLITDHEPLQWLMTNTKLTGMHARWANILQEYDLTIVHRTCLAILAGTLSEPEDPELTRLLSPDGIQAPERSLADAPEEIPADAHAKSPAQLQAESPADAQALAIVAPLREAADDDVDLPVRFDREIWEDAPVMAYLEAGVYANGVTPKQKDRIWHRAQSYQLKDGVLRTPR